jgi:beta-glucosidase
LLKNDNQTLPLKPTGTIALIGPLADDKQNQLGTWAISGNSDQAVSLKTGMENQIAGRAKIQYAWGANITDDEFVAKQANVFGVRVSKDPRTSQALIDEAVSIAKTSDIIIAAVGEASEFTGEASSMSSIDLPGSQKKLIEALRGLGKPLVVVLMSGRPMTIEDEANASTALIQAWFGGIESGNAIADVLFGAYNPSGKLSMTFPKNTGQIPIYYSIRKTGRPYGGGENRKFQSNYLDVSNEPLFPFGFGLSYTRFEYGAVNLNQNTLKPGQKIIAEIQLKNAGPRDGEETVQLYIQDVVASVTRPVKELKGFQKVFLRAGEEKLVRFEITVNDLKFYNAKLSTVAEPGEFKVGIGGNSLVTMNQSFRLN